MELTATFMALLEQFRTVFTSPSYATFSLLMTGWILSVRHRYVTDLIVSSDSVGNGHFSDYHRFFSQAKWNIDDLWRQLARLLVDHFFGPDAVIILAGDDTLCRKRGLGLFGAGMHHDPLISSRAMKLVSWGHDWVTLCVIVANPWWAPSKVFALPICMRLYRNKQGVTKGKSKAKGGSKKRTSSPSTKRQKKQAKRAQRKQRRAEARQRARRKDQKNTGVSTHVTRPELMREMLQLVASWFPERHFFFVGDSLYTGESVLSYLPANIDMIGAVHPKGALYEPAPEKRAGRGAPRKKGNRLPTRDRWAASRDPWTSFVFDQYGLHGTFETKTRQGLYYKAGKDRLLKFVLTRDAIGDRPTQIFYCTNLDLDPQTILATYAHRWAIEVTHHDAKQLLGLEDPANRVPLAVQRTAPMAMFLYSLTVLWYAQHGHEHVRFPERPWYPHKSEASFADMLTTLRRVSWEDKLSPVQEKCTLSKNSIRLLTYLATLAG
jgi:hypothetical protein